MRITNFLKKSTLFIFVFMSSFILRGQVDLSGAATQVSTIGAQAGGVIGGLVGLIGIGRAAYKFSTGDNDAVTSLIVGIVALVLGQLAATFL